MARLSLHYDKETDTLYVRKGSAKKMANFPLSSDTTICVDVSVVQVVGCVYEHLKDTYPKVHKVLVNGDRSKHDLIEEFFEGEIDRFNDLFESIRSKKALQDYINKEKPKGRFGSLLHR